MEKIGEKNKKLKKKASSPFCKFQDIDHDGKVSFADYKQAVEKEPALLETFGQCLPCPPVGSS